MEMESILLKMEEYPKPIGEWSNEDADNFLKNIIKSTSANTIQLYIHLMRQAHKFVCNIQGKNYVQLNPTHSLEDYVDLNMLRSVTLTEYEFNQVRKELKYVDNDTEGNYRDVALFELAWYGLSSEEIKFLKKDDIKETEKGIIIEIYKTKKGEKDKKEPTRVLNRSIIIDDPEIVKDILMAKKENRYYKVRNYESKDLIIVDEIYYIPSPYLIRGINNVKADKLKERKDKPIAHIGMLMYKQLKKIQLPEINIDFEHLSVEDIRRSMLINLILKEEIPIYSLKVMLNKKRDGDLIWLKSITDKMVKAGLL